MLNPPYPPDEPARLAALRDLGILDTPRDPLYDSLTRHLASLWQAPIAAISLIDTDRQWFKSEQGLGVSETPRSMSFCAHLLANRDEVLVVPDALADTRFADNPLVAGAPEIRFYAGAPLHDDSGMRLGALCVIDRAARIAHPTHLAALQDLATAVSGSLVLHRSLHRLNHLATTDPLTRALNRAGLERAFQQLGDRPLTLLQLDLDGFKGINDLHGHAAGDAALIEAVNRFQQAVRRGDTVARMGGDEFVILLDCQGDLMIGRRIAARIHRLFGNKFVKDGRTMHLGVSIGVAQRSAGETMGQLLSLSDQAMYHAKSAGKGCTGWQGGLDQAGA